MKSVTREIRAKPLSFSFSLSFSFVCACNRRDRECSQNLCRGSAAARRAANRKARPRISQRAGIIRWDKVRGSADRIDAFCPLTPRNRRHAQETRVSAEPAVRPAVLKVLRAVTLKVYFISPTSIPCLASLDFYFRTEFTTRSPQRSIRTTAIIFEFYRRHRETSSFYSSLIFYERSALFVINLLRETSIIYVWQRSYFFLFYINFFFLYTQCED